MVLFLLSQGADPDALSSSGRTPHEMARAADKHGSHAAVLHVFESLDNLASSMPLPRAVCLYMLFAWKGQERRSLV